MLIYALSFNPITVMAFLIGGVIVGVVALHLYAQWTIRDIDREQPGAVPVPISTRSRQQQRSGTP